MAFRQGYVTNKEDCVYNGTETGNGLFCNATWDTITCWEPSPAGVVAKQPCPRIFAADDDKYVYRSCGIDGQWEEPEYWEGFGFSDYHECTAHLKHLKGLFDVNGIDVSRCPKHADTVHMRSLYVVVSSASLLLLSGTIIFSILQSKSISKHKFVNGFKSKIWRNLLSMTFLETAISLCLHVGQDSIGLIVYGSIVHKVVRIVLQYISCSSLLWAILLLHFLNLSTKSKLLGASGQVMYYLIGLGIPIIPLALTTVTSFLTFKDGYWRICQSNYEVWILILTKILIIIFMVTFLVCSSCRLAKKGKCFQETVYFKQMLSEAKWYRMIVCFVMLQCTVDTTGAILSQSMSPHTDIANTAIAICQALQGAVFVGTLCGVIRSVRREMAAAFRREVTKDIETGTEPDDND